MHALPWLILHGDLIWQIGLVACLLSGLPTWLMLARIRVWRQARFARKTVGEPRVSLDEITDGMRVTLVGKLQVAGKSCIRFEDGQDVPAASIAYAQTRRTWMIQPFATPAGAVQAYTKERRAWKTALNARADQLFLCLGQTQVELKGPVEVLAGSEERWWGRPLSKLMQPIRQRVEKASPPESQDFSNHVVLFRYVYPGDTVRVRGMLRHEADTTDRVGYRQAAGRVCLVTDPGLGADGQSALQLAFEHTPRVKASARYTIPRALCLGAAAFMLIFGLGGEIAASLARAALERCQDAPAATANQAFDSAMRPVSLAEADPQNARLSMPPALQQPSLLLSDPESLLVQSLPAVERAIVDVLQKGATDPSQIDIPRDINKNTKLDEAKLTLRATLALQVAAVESTLLDDAESQRLIDLAMSDFDALDQTNTDPQANDSASTSDSTSRGDADDVTVLRAAIAIHAGKPDQARTLMQRLVHESRDAETVNLLLEWLRTRDMGHVGKPFLARYRSADAWSLMARGDGSQVVDFLRNPYTEPGQFLRLGAPAIVTNHDALLQWIRAGQRWPRWFASASSHLVEIATLSAAAQGLGDAHLAEELKQQAMRYKKALLRRDTAVLLAVLERL